MDARRRALQEDFSLPGWIYRDADFLRAEKARCLRRRGRSSVTLTTFRLPATITPWISWANPCCSARPRLWRQGFLQRLPASRLEAADGTAGHCPGRIVCPYHAWTYDLDGALVAVPHRKEFVDFAPEHYGLKPLEIEIYKGFIFVRLQPGIPSVADMFAPYEKELACYRFEELKPLGRVTCGYATSTGRM